MISQKVSDKKSNLFVTPPSNKLVSPKSITRKPSLVNFTKKKPTEIQQIRSSDRIRFISPSKANLFVSEESVDPQNSIQFSYTQYSAYEQINYPFIKQCASPKHFDSINISRKTSFVNDEGLKSNTSFISTFLEPSLQDFSNCQFSNSPINNPKLLQQQISNLKKQNFELNLLLDDKNDLLDKKKLQYDSRLYELTQELMEIKHGIQNSQSKIIDTESKILIYQTKNKELQDKLHQVTEKLEKAEKQVKMFKAKFRVNYYNPKEKEDSKTRKYHQNCCKGNQNFPRNSKNHEPSCNQNKPNTLKDSRKANMAEGPSLKKIKSQTVLPGCNITSFQCSPEASRLMKIHSNEEQFNQYLTLRTEIQNLNKEIRYKDIEILTLKKTKCEYQKEKQNFEKVKKFNKKLLARIQYLTKQCNEIQSEKRISLPAHTTPKKKFQNQYQDFDDQSESDEDVSEFLQFQLSPEKQICDSRRDSTDMIFELEKVC